MHQLLQGMGRHIVHQESPEDPWNRSILCCHKEAFNVLKEDLNKGTAKTQALLMDNKILFEDEHLKNSGTLALLGCLVLLCSKFYLEEDEDEGKLETESFTKMKNLELLQLNYVQLTGSYENFPKRLKWLCWHGFPSQYIPPDLPMTKLVVLDMSHSNLHGLWKVPKLLNSLKILDLSKSLKLIRTGEFSGVPNLERLIQAGCANLVEISESIGGLHGLALLDLSYCVKLRNLPRNMRELSETKTLRLDGCCNLFKLLTVHQSPHSSWLLLPQFIVELNLSGNDLNTESFPEDFSSFSSLTNLNLSYNPIDSLPDCVRSLSTVKILNISNCENLKSALDLSNSIKFLTVDGCGSLERITFHASSSILVRIFTTRCPNLREAQFSFELEKAGKVINKSLVWPSLGFLEHQEVIMYERRIFSTYFRDKKVPEWFTYKTNGSPISFIVPPSPYKKRIRGLKLCFVKTVSLDHWCVATTVIVNMTNNIRWVHDHLVASGDIVLMSHWIFEDNELNEGDEVCIHHSTHRKECWTEIGYCNPLRCIHENKEFEVDDESYIQHCKNVKGCGFDVVYDHHNSEIEETGTGPLDYYKSWEDRIGCIFVDVELCHLLQISIRGSI